MFDQVETSDPAEDERQAEQSRDSMLWQPARRLQYCLKENATPRDVLQCMVESFRVDALTRLGEDFSLMGAGAVEHTTSIEPGRVSSTFRIEFKRRSTHD